MTQHRRNKRKRGAAPPMPPHRTQPEKPMLPIWAVLGDFLVNLAATTAVAGGVTAMTMLNDPGWKDALLAVGQLILLCGMLFMAAKLKR